MPPCGTGGPAPDCSSFDAGATTGTVTFRAVIQDLFADMFPSCDPSVARATSSTTMDGMAPPFGTGRVQVVGG